MKLPIIQQPEYISPTAYKIWKTCEWKYYLKYLTGQRPKLPQTRAMACGSAFDSIVKSELAKDLNWFNQEKLSREKLLLSVDVDLRSIIIKPAEEIFAFYKASGAYQSLIDEGVKSVETEELKLVTDSNINMKIPIFGKPDITSSKGIIDWKVNGYGSKWGASSKRGFTTKYSVKGIEAGKESRSMDLIDEDWAIQLTVYNWITQESDLLEFKEISVGIDQIAIKGDDIKIVTYRTTIGEQFQRDLFLFFRLMWASILNGEIEDATPSKGKCYMYGQWCDVKDKCPKFQGYFGDADFNKLMS